MPQLVPCDMSDPGGPRRRTGKYKAPKPQKKGITGGLIGSGIAIAIIMFTMGFFPQVGDFFAQFNTNLQSHNDDIVAAIIQYFPTALLSVGICGTLFLIVNKLAQISNKRPTA